MKRQKKPNAKLVMDSKAVRELQLCEYEQLDRAVAGGVTQVKVLARDDDAEC
jgi:thiamine monophosphate synthase